MCKKKKKQEEQQETHKHTSTLITPQVPVLQINVSGNRVVVHIRRKRQSSVVECHLRRTNHCGGSQV